MVLNKTNGSSFRNIFLIYITVIGIFSFLFYLPISNKENMEFIDSLFLSASALSVTGLSTVNVGSDLTFWGQTLLMIEIQLGGMGILILISYLFLMMGKRITMSNMLLISKDQNQSNLKTIKRLSFMVLVISLMIESICFFLIFGDIKGHLGDTNQAIFVSMFHSVASFTNAGFSLIDLSVFQTNHIFLWVTALAVVLGSVGFPTIVECLTSFRRKKSLFTKINIRMHLSLLLVGSVIYLAAEYNKIFYELNLYEKITNAVFMSAANRSGGLAVVDIAGLSLTTILVSMCLMFIGGASSSTGGGIRLTTFRVLIAKMVSVARSKKNTFIGKSSVSDETINKSFLIFFSFVVLIMGGTILVSMVENRSLEVIVFEVVSALTNTGLSLGITESLADTSKVILICLMIVGRIGIFTFIYLVFKADNSKIEYLQEEIAVG